MRTNARGARPGSAAARLGLALPALVALLAGCAGAPRQGPGAVRDGPGADIPPDLQLVADAQPRVEPLRAGGANKPYTIGSETYVPVLGDPKIVERGLASWYGRKYHGRATASGEVYDMYAMTAAHRTMPLPSYARVRNPANGREVIVRVNDRGPFAPGRVIDLSYTAALKLDVLRGVAPVEVERLTYDEIRSGRWRDGAAAVAAAPPPPAPAALPPAPAPVVTTPLPEPTAAAPATGFWVQLGAFAQRDGALGFQRRVADELDWLAPRLAVFEERAVHRLQAGPWPSRDEARQVAERIRAALQLVPLVIERP